MKQTRKQFRTEIKAYIAIILVVSLIIAVMLTSCTTPKEYAYKDHYKHLHTPNKQEQAEINKMINQTIKIENYEQTN